MAETPSGPPEGRDIDTSATDDLEQDEPRFTEHVTTAAEAVAEDPPEEEVLAGEPAAEDESGRPPLAAVAAERAATRNVRVIDTQERK